jgi:dTDP-glucose 4,6-dehydratase
MKNPPNRRLIGSVNRRRVSRLLIESLLWFLSAAIATWIRYDGVINQNQFSEIFSLGLFGSICFIGNNILLSVYKVKYRIASVEEIMKISLSVILTTLFLFTFRITFSFPNLPRLIPLLCGLIALLLQILLRVLVSKKTINYFFLNRSGIKTIIYGSGITGQQIVEQMLFRSKEYNPIGFLDDSSDRSNFVFMRRKVLGTISDLPVIVMDKKPAILIVAITGISSVNLIDLERKCKELNILIRIIPSALEIMENDLSLGDISDLKIENILGRHQIDYDNHEITNFLRAKKILITGAGGSIGSEIARQISALNVSDLFLLDLSENSLLELSLSINNDGLFNENNIILCDIRDSALLSKLVEKLKPDVVFHAAALKHLALLEKFPQEAYKTNVIATKNLVDSCLKNGVKYFVNISTDKAVEPISELGKSKFLSERIISGINEPDKKYISVRFGNVVGSNGSFLHTFRHQIQNGGPVTVTHPEVSRYFMTIKEAVYLVLQSIIVGKCGETMILDMGEPIKINEVAKKMISDSGKEIEIKYTNLRSGEKLHEVLTGQNEIVYYGTHRNIRHTKVKPINLNEITYEML